jgi:hypothetical protein
VLKIKFDLYGWAATKKLMRQLEPDLLRDMDKTIKGQLDPIVAKARLLTPTQAPLSGWNRRPFAPGSRPSYSPYGKRWDYNRLEWNTSEAKQKIVIRQPGRRPRGSLTRPIYQLQSNDPANAVFELMGRGKSRVWMIGNVGRRYPGTGRVLYRAFDTAGGKDITKEVVATIKRFELDFNRRLDAAGGSP